MVDQVRIELKNKKSTSVYEAYKGENGGLLWAVSGWMKPGVFSKTEAEEIEKEYRERGFEVRVIEVS